MSTWILHNTALPDYKPGKHRFFDSHFIRKNGNFDLMVAYRYQSLPIFG
jgi:hypothetical protein